MFHIVFGFLLVDCMHSIIKGGISRRYPVYIHKINEDFGACGRNGNKVTSIFHMLLVQK